MNDLVLQVYGTNAAHRGNLVGVQPYMFTDDYRSATRFRASLERYLSAAAAAGWLSERSVVVFPEYIGAWLVALGEAEGVYRVRTLQQAMLRLATHHPFSLLRVWLHSRPYARARLEYSLFCRQAEAMAETYHTVLSGLARQYAVTLVGGSILLPCPRIEADRLVVQPGPLYNVTAVYRPDGRAYPRLVYKAFPIQDELGFVTAGHPDDLPVFDTPAGRLGVLICADSWYPAAYAAWAAQKVELIVVPSFLSHNGAWSGLWRGYSGAPAPADVDAADPGRLSEGQAWLKYALAARLSSAGARYGLNVFLRGQLWDLGSDGQTILVGPNGAIRIAPQDGPVLVNLWLDKEVFQ